MAPVPAGPPRKCTDVRDHERATAPVLGIDPDLARSGGHTPDTDPVNPAHRPSRTVTSTQAAR